MKKGRKGGEEGEDARVECHGKCGTLRLNREIDGSGKRGGGFKRRRMMARDGGGLSRITSEEDLASSLVLHV